MLPIIGDGDGRMKEEGVEAGLGAFDVHADSRLEAVERWQWC
jgi:hypothetical protein